VCVCVCVCVCVYLSIPNPVNFCFVEMKSLHNKGGYMRRIACSHFGCCCPHKETCRYSDEQHAIFAHELQRALRVMLGFSNIYFVL